MFKSRLAAVIACLGLSVVPGAPALAAEPAASAPTPLDLTLPRETTQAERARAESEARTPRQAPHAAPPPYGAGYETRMSVLRASGVDASPASRGGLGAGSGPPARGGRGRGR